MSDEKRTILIIDDDITVRKLISHHLRANDFNILEAKDAREGLGWLNDKAVDLVLCDISMNEMDGFTFCKMVREQDKFKLLPFVFVTAKTSIEDKSQALEAGGDDLITKPFNIEELILKVKGLLRRSDILKEYGTKKPIEQSFSEETLRVVLVDDDLSLARLFQYNLSKSGFECEVASGAEEGMAIIKKSPPDIIISDIMMPEIDGFTFRRMLLSEQALRQIPFVFLTAKGDEADILDGYDLGITDYVIKTAGPRVVVAKVSAILKSLGKERQRAVTELHEAADSLRVKVVPDRSPKFEGFKIEQWHMPFKGIPGGDFIDYFELDDENLAVILGDVMGKKWGAWYFAFAYAGYIRSAIRVVLQNSKEYSPSEILQQVNKSVYKDAKVSEVFTTLSIVVINRVTKSVKYSGAGDLPIIYRSEKKSEVSKISSTGMLLGFMEEGSYKDESFTMNEGDFIMMVTDGIMESRNKDGEQFGAHSLEAVLKELSLKENPFEKIKSEFVKFTGNKFEDDISIIFIQSV
jgi:sigma-B regulation protein RsbU (phosphoserine phosphatase)